ncbi:hypothetical protein Tco_0478506 [Tanacetum coccineum]
MDGRTQTGDYCTPWMKEMESRFIVVNCFSIRISNELKKSKYENPSNTATDSFFKAYEVCDIEKQSQTKRKYSNTSKSIKELPNKRRCKAEKFEAIQYSLGPNEEYIAIRSDLDNSTSNVLIPLDSWTSGLLVYKLPLSELSKGANSLQAEEQDIPPPTITAMKIPIIRKEEYDIWSMRMRQYICHTDHNLWDVIVNGDLEEEPAPTGETYAPPAPKTAKQLAANFGCN